MSIRRKQGDDDDATLGTELAPLAPDRSDGRKISDDGPVLPMSVHDTKSGQDISANTKPLYLRPMFFGIVAISFMTRFYGLDFPATVVFDEVHFGKFTNWTMEGKYYFDIHPPLGKLVLALWGTIIGYKDHYPFETIGQAYGGTYYYYLRWCPAFFSALLPPLTYLLVHEAGLSTPAALLACAMVLFDNCIFGEGRFILVDSQLFFWILMALWMYFGTKRRKLYSREWYIWAFLTGFSLAMASSVKWTGLGVVGCIGLDVAADLLSRVPAHQEDNLQEWLKEFIVKLVLYLILPLFFYFFVFAVHFWCLPYSGSGNDFMSWEFKARLKGIEIAPHIKPKGLIASIFELQSVMFRSNNGLTAKHNWGSTWMEWPTMSGKGVLYWAMNNGKIYLNGNPFVWWITTAGTCVMIWALMKPLMRSKFVLDIPDIYSSKRERVLAQRRWAKLRLGLFFIIGYVLNWAPYMLISRVCFIYHYIPALLFAILTTATVFDYLVEHNGLKVLIVGGVTVLIGLTFWYYMPWQMGTPMDPAAHASRVWRANWT